MRTARDGRFLMGCVRGALPEPVVQRLTEVLAKAARSGSSNRGFGAGPIPEPRVKQLLERAKAMLYVARTHPNHFLRIWAVSLSG